jgi:excinuclease ABC subunit B
MTDSMKRAIDETDRRRATQMAYNEENGITPMSVIRPLDHELAKILNADYADLTEQDEEIPEFASETELHTYIAKLEQQMREAAKAFEFEKAAATRDKIRELRSKEFLFA